MRHKSDRPNYARGMIFALGGPIVGVLLSVALWKIGFIASFASFALAWLTIYLYQIGIKNRMNKLSIYIILSYVAGGVLLSVLSMMFVDLLDAALQEDKTIGVGRMLGDALFWDYINQNIFHNLAFWKGYTTSLLMAVAFAIWGSYGIVKQLILSVGREDQ